MLKSAKNPAYALLSVLCLFTMVAMKHIARILIGLLLVSSLPVLPVRAGSQTIVIVEVSMGSGNDAADEYVVWHNNSGAPVDIAGWAIQYKSATGTSWSKKATIPAGVELDSYDDYTLATKLETDLKMTSGLSQVGGNMRIINSKGEVIDQLAWGDGDSPEAKAVTACNPGQSLLRKMDEDTLIAQDSDDNSADFEIYDPSAVATSVEPVVTTTESSDPSTDQAIDSANNSNGDIIINELLPDPVTPLSDSSDEFIELYNAEGQAVNLKNWSLLDKSSHKYTIGDVLIEPHGYAVFYSKDTKISLNNDGDSVLLLDPNGIEVDVSPNYDKAKAGLSWGLVDGAWAWTVEETPGGLNAAAATSDEAIAAAQSKAKEKAKTKAAKAKSSAAAKKASTKKVASSKKAPADKKIDSTSADTQKPGASWWTWLLIILGAGTIGYGIYEYRPEITLLYHKLRTKLGFWGKAS